MSDINLDEPGFTAPAGSTVPPSSNSSVEQPPDGRNKCVACPRRMSAKTAETPIVFVVSFVLSATPQTGGNGQGI